VSRRFGLIAGLGRFPFEVARAARARGDRVLAAGIRGLTDPALAQEVDALHWFGLGELQSFIDTFRSEGIRDAAMAGKVPKSFLYENAGSLELDALARELLARLADQRDDSLLGAFARAVEDAGIHLCGQADLTPALRAQAGVLGARRPTPAQWRDVLFGWPVAQELARLDIGQTVVVKDTAVMALEAIEGTDATIARGGALGGGDVCVVKVAKPSQDPRFDIPVVGLATIEALAAAGARVLAIEAGQSVLLEREAALALADRVGVAVVGVAAPGPADEVPE